MYVGNLALQTTDEELLAVFKKYGQVASANVMKNVATGEAHGFGYVEMDVDAEGQSALANLDGSELLGRKLTVIRQQPWTVS